MFDFIKSIFGFSSVVDSATKIIDKIAGTDWLPKERAAFLLKYMESTKHQSVARRFISISIVLMWLVMAISWLVASIVGRFMYEEVLNPGTVLAADISAFLSSNMNENLAILVGFYFGVQGIGVLSGAISKK